MAARKSRPVLYELIAQSQPTTTWTRPAQPNQPAGPHIAKVPAAAPGTIDTQRSPGALATWIGRRANVALSTPYVAAIGIVAILLLALAYYAGRKSGDEHPGTSTSLEQALLKTPSEAIIVDERPRPEPTATHRPTRPVAVPPRAAQPQPEPPRDEQAAAPGAPPAETAARPDVAATPHVFESGKSYVIVQHLSKRGPGPQAAERIRDFLTAGGVPCVVHAGGADLIVVATEPFAIDPRKRKDAADPERKRAQQLMDRIRKLGEQYVTNGYSFKDCYLREF